MNRILCLLALALSLLLAAACAAPIVAPSPAADAPADAPAAPAADRIRIAFVSHTQDVTDLFGQMKIGFEETLQANGIEYELFAGAPPSSADHERMDQILSDMLAVRPSYLVFGPTAFELNQPRLVELEQAGTKIIMTDYPPPATGFDINPLTWVIYDHGEMGRRSGLWAGEYFCEAGMDNFEVAIFWGPAASEISQARGEGVLRGLTEATEACGISYAVVEEVHADFNQERAFNLAETVATAHPGLDLAVGMNSVTALGIAESLAVQGRLDDVMVIGMGGTPPELAAICRGDVGVAPFRDPRDMGRLAATAIMLDLEGRTDEIPEISWTELPIIDSCDRAFEVVPRPFLDQQGFRGQIPEEMWQDE
jgi:ABC-type sugar transport system substrate-binding protein